MRIFCSSVLLLIWLYSCTGKIHYPAKVLRPTEMQEVFWDMIKADALASEVVMKDSSKKILAVSVGLYKNVFISHHITKDIFDSSYSFYQKHPYLMRVLLDSMNAERERRKALLYQRPVITPQDTSKVKS